MNNPSLISKNQQMMLSGANTVGLVSLLAFVIKNFNEMNQSLEEIRTEFSTLKNYINENTKRANLSFNRLNQKIEETTDSYKKNVSFIDKETPEVVRPHITEHKTDEITSAINSLLG